MFWFLVGLVYFIGYSYTVRLRVLSSQRKIDEINDWSEKCVEYGAKESPQVECRYEHCTDELYCDHHGAASDKAKRGRFTIPLVWPLILVHWLWWKTLFPRGVRTPGSIARDKDEEHKRQVKELEDQAQKIKELSAAAGLSIPSDL